MKILMLSDMHISNEEDVEKARKIIRHMKTKLSDLLNDGEKLVVVNLGDIADFNAYHTENGCIHVEQVLENLQESLYKWNTRYEFVPGNHDMGKTPFLKFDEVINPYIDTPYDYAHNHIVGKIIDGFNFIFVNSSTHGDHNYGEIQFDKLDKYIVTGMCNIIVCHHSVFSEDKQDTANIRGATELLKFIDVDIILNGHTHGEISTTIDHIRKIGVGSIFKPEANINNQFNLLELNNFGYVNVKNYRFMADKNEFVEVPSETSKEELNL